MTDNLDNSNKTRHRFFIETLGLILVVLTPFIFKIHDYLPRNPEETISIFGVTFDRNGFADLRTYAWFLLNKLVPLYLLIIWFFTCKHWWYHIILIPLCMYAFQVFEVIYSEDQFVDTENVLWLLPVCMIVIPFVYFVRIKLYDKYVHGIDLEAMEAELKSFKEKGMQNQNIQTSVNSLEEVSETEVDLSENVSKRTLSKLLKQFQLTVKNLFNFM
jgi:hypothetical protein